jgi:hypothetical protein
MRFPIFPALAAVTTRLVPFNDVIVFPKLKPFAEIDNTGLVANGHHVDASLTERRDCGIRRIKPIGNENVAPIHRVEHFAEKRPFPGPLSFMRRESEIDHCARCQRNHCYSAHDGKPKPLLDRSNLRERELIFWGVWHRQTCSVNKEHFAVSPVPRGVSGIMNVAADLLGEPNHDRQRESAASIAVAGGRRRASRQARCDAVGKDARHCLIQRFILTQTLRQPSPERDERAKDALAVFVAFCLKRSQNVLASQEPTERQAAIVREFVPDGAEVFAWHLVRFPVMGRTA